MDKQQVLDGLESIINKYSELLSQLHPSLNIYQDVKDFKSAAQELRTEVEEGKYDK